MLMNFSTRNRVVQQSLTRNQPSREGSHAFEDGSQKGNTCLHVWYLARFAEC